MGKKPSVFLFSKLCFGLAFLYVPMAMLVVYSLITQNWSLSGGAFPSLVPRTL
ncbi:MAG: hypothetical protein CM1200mP41_13800 [Gammaproteobacteria bacterium]|nr:MAG: hypothetical protein CM1200mP41_13800 [Gammaproteobacteria bacterium]